MKAKKGAKIIFYILLIVILYSTLAVDYADFMFALNKSEKAYSDNGGSEKIAIYDIIAHFISTVAHSLIVVFFTIGGIKSGVKAYNLNREQFNEVKKDEHD